MSNAFSIKDFMKEELKVEQIVEIPGIKTFCDKDGNPIPMKIRVITSGKLSELRNLARKRTMAKDKKGKPIFQGGQIQFTEEVDTTLLTDTMIAESLVFPDLHDKELLAYYGEQEAVKLVHKVFAKIEDYQYISDQITEVSGIGKDADELIDEAKN